MDTFDPFLLLRIIFDMCPDLSPSLSPSIILDSPCRAKSWECHFVSLVSLVVH